MMPEKKDVQKMERWLQKTPLLSYDAPALARLVYQRQWQRCNETQKIAAIYDFVQNDILFGYNHTNAVRVSSVLRDGYGQCNTKAILLMALLRAVGVPCHLHGSLAGKDFQRGATSFLINWFAPATIVRTWVEVCHYGKWVALEGEILDHNYFLR